MSDRNVSADGDPIVDMDVPAEHGSVCHHDIVSDLAVVGDVDATHEVPVASDSRHAIFFFARAIDGDAFPNHVVVANDHLGFGSAVTDILRFSTDYDSGEDPIVFTNRHPSGDRDIVLEDGPGANFDIGSDDAEGSNLNPGSDFTRRINNGHLGNSWR